MNSFLKKVFIQKISQKARLIQRLCFFFLFVFLLGLTVIKTFFPSFQIFPEPRITLLTENWQKDHLPFIMTPLTLFAAPQHLCPIEEYGAVGDGVTLNTRAFTRAIEDCAKQGGGRVIVPPGKFLTGGLVLKSNITLEVQAGAELLFSKNYNDYLPTVFSRYEGIEYYNYAPPLYARNCHDVAITGSGIIDGQGEAWWEWKRWQQKAAKELYALAETNTPVEDRVFGTVEDGLRPSLIQFVNCERVLVEDVLLRNGPMWTLHPLYSKDLVFRNIAIETWGPNNDGIVLDSSENVLVENVRLNTEDDAIVIKSGVDKDGKRVGKPSQNIVIRNCFVGRGNGGVVIGSEMSGDVRNVFVSHCQFDGTKRGFRVKSAPGRGGIVENIWVEDITMDNIVAEAIFLNMYYDSKNVVRPTTAEPPVFRNFFFKNITGRGANNAIILTGANDSFIQNISFENIEIQSTFGSSFRNVSGLALQALNLHAQIRPLLTFDNVQNTAVTTETFTPLPSYRPIFLIQGAQSKNIVIEKSLGSSLFSKKQDVPKTALRLEDLSLTK